MKQLQKYTGETEQSFVSWWLTFFLSCIILGAINSLDYQVLFL